MRVLITGGAGFIGSNLVRRLCLDEQVETIRVIDDLSTGSLHNLAGLDIDFVSGTILDTDGLSTVTRGMDAVVHLGAIPSVPRSISNPRASHDANATGTLNVLEAARDQGVAHVLVASSSSVYGANPAMPKNEFDWTRPMSPYAASKLATEAYALAYQYSFGLRTLAFRFFNVFGPAQDPGHPYAAVIPRFLDAVLSGRPVEIHGDGTQSRDFTYVGTVCAVLSAALQRGVSSPDPVNLAYGSNTTLLELVDLMETILERPITRRFTAARVGDVKASQADSARLRQLFPEVEPVQLRSGLDATLAWFRAERGGSGV